MLFILYGGTGELRYKCREFFVKKNFTYVRKYSALLGESLPFTPFEQREVLTLDELNARCDFFYELPDIRVGFEQSQIMDAARGVSDAFLTLSTYEPSGMEMLRKIKQHYGNYVTLMYMYIEEPVFESLFSDYPDESNKQFNRAEIGKKVRKAYFENLTLFDYVIVSGIKDGKADYDMINYQLETIYRNRRELELEENNKRHVELPYNGPQPYIFVSYAHNDKENVEEILFQLQRSGYRIWFDDGIKGGDHWKDVIFQKIKNSAAVLFIRSGNSIQSDDVRAELETARTLNKTIFQVALEKQFLDDMSMEGLDMYLNRTQKILYQSNKTFYDKLKDALPQDTCITQNG